MNELFYSRVKPLAVWLSLTLLAVYACEQQPVAEVDGRGKTAVDCSLAENADKTVCADTEDVLAVINNIPAHPTKTAPEFQVENVAAFKYKAFATGTGNCKDAADYSDETDSRELKLANFTTLLDGDITLCLVGKSKKGKWQDFANASQYSWTKDTTAPAFISLSLRNEAANGFLNATERGAATETAGNLIASGYDTAAYALVPSSVVCDDSVTFSADIPAQNSGAITSDGAYKVCIMLTDAAGNTPAFGSTADLIVDTAAPTAALAGQPSGTTLATALAITVSGTDVVSYKYKVGVTAATTCSDQSNYGAKADVASLITDDISSLADGAITLCTIGSDLAGNWQALAAATSISWTKDTSAPTATYTGEPASTSAAAALAVTVSGTDVTHYQAKAGVAASTDCTAASGYSGETAVATAITTIVSALADGALKLCIIGRDITGNWQPMPAPPATHGRRTAPAR